MPRGNLEINGTRGTPRTPVGLAQPGTPFGFKGKSRCMYGVRWSWANLPARPSSTGGCSQTAAVFARAGRPASPFGRTWRGFAARACFGRAPSRRKADAHQGRPPRRSMAGRIGSRRHARATPRGIPRGETPSAGGDWPPPEPARIPTPHPRPGLPLVPAASAARALAVRALAARLVVVLNPAFAATSSHHSAPSVRSSSLLASS